MKHTFGDGKYTVQEDNGSDFKALRHDEEWRSLTGDSLVLAMLYDYDAAQSELAALREELATANNAYQIVLETCGKAVDKMTAAEQRNAELTEALEGMVEYFPYGHSDGECFSIDKACKVLKKNPLNREKANEQ
jgi:hypothetical protein